VARVREEPIMRCRLATPLSQDCIGHEATELEPTVQFYPIAQDAHWHKNPYGNALRIWPTITSRIVCDVVSLLWRKYGIKEDGMEGYPAEIAGKM
jgi:hypothetical protein